MADDCTAAALAPGKPSVANGAGEKSYHHILKSSSLIGASSVIDIAFRITRTKVIALLLGPSGIGLLGLYNSIIEVTRSIAGLGVNSSGVRQIAEAVGTGDAKRISRTITTLRGVALCSGVVGALLLLIFSGLVAKLTFGDESRAMAVALLALAVLFGDVSAAQAALVQGMRRISDLAKMNILGAMFGTIFSIPIVYFYGERGLVPSLLCVAVMGILTSWWYARKIKVERVPMTVSDVVTESTALLRLGLVFMLTGLMGSGAAYLVRIIIVRDLGVESAGYFQSGWALGGMYAGFILSSMAADFYPRLTAVANDNVECNRLVNEQAEVGLLLACPGLLATLVLCPLIVSLFYSAKFGPAVEILRWMCLGMLLRIGSWPMGIILLAKGVAKIYFWCELVTSLLFVGVIWASMLAFGLNGTGIGFCGVYVLYWIGMYFVVRRLTGFRWSAENRRWALIFVPLTAIVFASWYVLPRPAAVVLGSAAILFASIYSLKTLCALLPQERFPQFARKLISAFRLTPKNWNS